MTKVDTHKTDCFGRIHWATAPKAYNAIIYPVIESFQTRKECNKISFNCSDQSPAASIGISKPAASDSISAMSSNLHPIKSSAASTELLR